MAEEFVDLVPGFHRKAFVVIDVKNATLSVVAWRTLGEPTHVRIRVNREQPDVVKILPESEAGENSIKVQANQGIGSLLRTYAAHLGFKPGRYEATMEDDALVIRLERKEEAAA